MSLFKPPTPDYFDHYDRSRFMLVWNISLGILVVLICLILINIQTLSKTDLPNFIALGISICIIAFLKITHKYKVFSKIASISSVVLISNTFFFLTDDIHYNTSLWMLMNILFTFFTLGKIWGTIISVLHFIPFTIYVAFYLNANLQEVGSLDPKEINDLVAESILVGSGLIYVIYQFILSNNYAENAIKEINSSLTEQNKIITFQNEEKNVMLKEIHHRVKNNLQVITSLLRLQSREIEDPQQLSSFDEAINRVKSMSLIHEKMYQTNLLTNFDFESYVQSLSQALVSAYSFQTEIDLEVNSSLTAIGSKNIVSISLLFNELISNSIKHAFTEIDKPRITISLSKNYLSETYTLVYKDNGKWKESTTISFGTELICAMTEQLDGTFELTTNEETKYVFLLNNLSD